MRSIDKGTFGNKLLALLLTVITLLCCCACTNGSVDVSGIDPEAVNTVNELIAQVRAKVAAEAELVKAKAEAAIAITKEKRAECEAKIADIQGKIDTCSKAITTLKANFEAFKETLSTGDWKKLYEYYTQQYRKAEDGK